MVTTKKLKKFLKMKALASKLEKEIDKIKSEILTEGSFSRGGFEVEVTTVQQFRTVSAPDLLAALGPVLVTQHALINKSSYKKVTVKEVA